MNEYNDDFGILEAFNDASQILANNFKQLLPTYEINPNQDSTIQIPLMDLGVDIDEWWGLNTGGSEKVTEFCALYIEWLKKKNEDDYRRHFADSLETLNGTTFLKDDYDEKLLNAYNKDAIKIRYLPHVIRYAQDFLNKFDGVKALREKCEDYNLQLSFMLSTNAGAEHLHAPDAYSLSAIIETVDHDDTVLNRIGLRPDSQRLN